MTPTIEHYLALVTLAMPVILAAAHFARRLAVALHRHALTTTYAHDDRVTQWILNVATWLDVIATFAGTAASGGLNRTPGIERVENDQ